MKRALFGMMAFVAAAMFLATQAQSQPPRGKDDKDGPKGPPRFEIGQLFPPPLMEELKLTPDQMKELDGIKRELRTKMEKLLTPEQMKKVENFRPRGPGGPGGPEGKGPPLDDKGKRGPGDKGGDRPPPPKPPEE